MDQQQEIKKPSVSYEELLNILFNNNKIEDEDRVESINVTQKGLEIDGRGYDKSGKQQIIHVTLPITSLIPVKVEQNNNKTELS